MQKTLAIYNIWVYSMVVVRKTYRNGENNNEKRIYKECTRY